MKEPCQNDTETTSLDSADIKQSDLNENPKSTTNDLPTDTIASPVPNLQNFDVSVNSREMLSIRKKEFQQVIDICEEDKLTKPNDSENTLHMKNKNKRATDMENFTFPTPFSSMSLEVTESGSHESPTPELLKADPTLEQIETNDQLQEDVLDCRKETTGHGEVTNDLSIVTYNYGEIIRNDSKHTGDHSKKNEITKGQSVISLDQSEDIIEQSEVHNSNEVKFDESEVTFDQNQVKLDQPEAPMSSHKGDTNTNTIENIRMNCISTNNLELNNSSTINIEHFTRKQISIPLPRYDLSKLNSGKKMGVIYAQNKKPDNEIHLRYHELKDGHGLDDCLTEDIEKTNVSKSLNINFNSEENQIGSLSPQGTTSGTMNSASVCQEIDEVDEFRHFYLSNYQKDCSKLEENNDLIKDSDVGRKENVLEKSDKNKNLLIPTLQNVNNKDSKNRKRKKIVFSNEDSVNNPKPSKKSGNEGKQGSPKNPTVDLIVMPYDKIKPFSNEMKWRPSNPRKIDIEKGNLRDPTEEVELNKENDVESSYDSADSKNNCEIQDTRLPLKKRKHSVANAKDEIEDDYIGPDDVEEIIKRVRAEECVKDISYPAEPAISIAEIEGKLFHPQPRTFRTPAQKKVMLPPPISLPNASQPLNIVTEQYNNHVYYSPTINYDPYSFFPCASSTYFPPVLLPIKSSDTFDVNTVNSQQSDVGLDHSEDTIEKGDRNDSEREVTFDHNQVNLDRSEAGPPVNPHEGDVNTFETIRINSVGESTNNLELNKSSAINIERFTQKQIAIPRSDLSKSNLEKKIIKKHYQEIHLRFRYHELEDGRGLDEDINNISVSNSLNVNVPSEKNQIGSLLSQDTSSSSTNSAEIEEVDNFRQFYLSNYRQNCSKIERNSCTTKDSSVERKENGVLEIGDKNDNLLIQNVDNKNSKVRKKKRIVFSSESSVDGNKKIQKPILDSTVMIYDKIKPFADESEEVPYVNPRGMKWGPKNPQKMNTKEENVQDPIIDEVDLNEEENLLEMVEPSCVSKNNPDRKFAKEEPDTRLPLKKRRHSVVKVTIEHGCTGEIIKRVGAEESEKDISYPAEPAISIAEIQEKLVDPQPRTFKTPAQKKEMPPLPISFPNVSQPPDIVTQLYNNPTINYHMNNVPYSFFPCTSLTYFPPVLFRKKKCD